MLKAKRQDQLSSIGLAKQRVQDAQQQTAAYQAELEATNEAVEGRRRQRDGGRLRLELAQREAQLASARSSGGERRRRRHKHRKHKHQPRRIKVEQAANEQSAMLTGGVAAAPPRSGTGSRSDAGSLSDDGDDDIATLQAQAMAYLTSEVSQPREHGEAKKKRKHCRR